MIVCEQTRLRFVVWVGWLFYQSLSRLGSLAFSVHQESANVTASSDKGLRRIRCCAVFHRSAVVVLMRRALFFTYSWHLSVGTDVYTACRPTYTQGMFASLCICWFKVRLLWVLEIAVDCSRHDGWNHPVRIHLTLSQAQLVEMVTWQIQYVKRQGFRFSLQFTQCKQEAAKVCQHRNHDVTCLSDWAIYRCHR